MDNATKEPKEAGAVAADGLVRMSDFGKTAGYRRSDGVVVKTKAERGVSRARARGSARDAEADTDDAAPAAADEPLAAAEVQVGDVVWALADDGAWPWWPSVVSEVTKHGISVDFCDDMGPAESLHDDLETLGGSVGQRVGGGRRGARSRDGATQFRSDEAGGKARFALSPARHRRRRRRRRQQRRYESSSSGDASSDTASSAEYDQRSELIYVKPLRELDEVDDSFGLKEDAATLKANFP